MKRDIEFYKGLKKGFVEIKDENGKSIGNILGITQYKDSLIVYTGNAMYSDNPNIFKEIKD